MLLARPTRLQLPALAKMMRTWCSWYRLLLWLRTQPAQSRQTSATTTAAAVIQAANLGARKIAATIAASQYANAAATSITTLMETTTSRWLVAVAYAAPSFAVINPIARAASAVVLAFQCWRLAALLS